MNLSKSRGADPDPESKADLGLREKLNLLERRILLDTLFRANWIKKQAAAMLQIDVRNLPYLLHKHNLSEGVQRH